MTYNPNHEPKQMPKLGTPEYDALIRRSLGLPDDKPKQDEPKKEKPRWPKTAWN